MIIADREATSHTEMRGESILPWRPDVCSVSLPPKEFYKLKRSRLFQEVSISISLRDMVEVLPFGLEVRNPVLSLLWEMKKMVVREGEDERGLHRGASSLPISQGTLFGIS